MRVKLRRLLQTVSGSLFFFCLCVLLLRDAEGPVTLQDGPGERWNDRVPQSLKAEDYLALVAEDKGTSVVQEDLQTQVVPFKAKGWDARSDFARLEDIFISVKTTKRYHSSRLDIILGTWFTLAPKQVSSI